ncbi:MAG: elongation factor P hydroxylase [Bacteriovoracia bacterium]
MKRGSDPRKMTEVTPEVIIELFDRTFLASTNTRLRGGFPEPIYLPEQAPGPAEIRFTRDYLRSALHEIAHWCIAGAARRREVDYGYWYRPDGRNAAEQMEFFRIEVKPQAVELAFSRRIGVDFQVSCDNLDGVVPAHGSFTEKDFAALVDRQLADVERDGFPPRARIFLDALEMRWRRAGCVENSESIGSWINGRRPS